MKVHNAVTLCYFKTVNSKLFLNKRIYIDKNELINRNINTQ